MKRIKFEVFAYLLEMYGGKRFVIVHYTKRLTTQQIR